MMYWKSESVVTHSSRLQPSNHLITFMFGCSGTQIYDPEVRDEGSGQPWDDWPLWSSVLPWTQTWAVWVKGKSLTAWPPLFLHQFDFVCMWLICLWFHLNAKSYAFDFIYTWFHLHVTQSARDFVCTWLRLHLTSSARDFVCMWLRLHVTKSVCDFVCMWLHLRVTHFIQVTSHTCDIQWPVSVHCPTQVLGCDVQDFKWSLRYLSLAEVCPCSQCWTQTQQPLAEWEEKCTPDKNTHDNVKQHQQILNNDLLLGWRKVSANKTIFLFQTNIFHWLKKNRNLLSIASIHNTYAQGSN